MANTVYENVGPQRNFFDTKMEFRCVRSSKIVLRLQLAEGLNANDA